MDTPIQAPGSAISDGADQGMTSWAGRALPVRFTASGSEYFRIWIVNLLLTIVTLGFYLPFAKARRLRYFYANTLVDEQPLAFHGDAWKMFRGYLLMLVLFGGYAVSSYVSHWVALGAFVVLALLWPALWRSSLMFRLGNTSWRGLRMSFEGGLDGAYGAMLPLFVPALLILAATAWFLNGVDPGDRAAVKAANNATAPFVGLSMLLLMVMMPWSLWRMKVYQHGGYRYAREATTYSGRLRSFYGLGLKLVLVAVLAIVVIGVGVGVSFALAKTSANPKAMAFGIAIPIAVLTAMVYIWLFSLAGAGLQNLAWNPTQSAQLRFSSSLRVGAFTWLNIRNMALVIVTLGLFRPFAVVSVLRMRLEAVEVRATGHIDSWAADMPAPSGTGSGEMAGDFFGIDVGL